MESKSNTKNYVIFGIGISLIIVGLACAIYGPLFFRKMVKEELELSHSSYATKLWLHTPLPLYLDVYLFNWTNIDDYIKDKSVTPHFDEVGPFVFQEVHDRVNVQWSASNETVTYNQTRRWNFVPEESQDLSTQITNMNVIATTVSQMISKKIIGKKFIDIFMKHLEHFSVTSTAKKWLFDGIQDNLLDILNLFKDIIHFSIPFDKFGWFYQRNMSAAYDGIFTVKTGVSDIYEIGIIEKWNHDNKTNFYYGQCGMVNGTSGELFPPVKDNQKNLTLFISDICSSITLDHSDSEEVEGINSYRYVGGKNALDNGQINPENKCFCKDECAPYGARDVSACRLAPLFFSFPHFYLADESYLSSLSGLVPNKSEHEFVLHLDPVTGIPTQVKAQFQINVLLKPVHGLKMYENVTKLYVPMMWFRERATITPELALKAIMLHYIPPVSIGVLYGVVAVGFLMIVLRLFCIWRENSTKSETELLIPPSVDRE